MSDVVIEWDGIPVPKARARSFGFHKADGKIGTRHYTPDTTVEFEERLKYAAFQAMAGRPPFDGAVIADIDIRFPLPASAKKATKQAVAAGELVPHIVRPDKDNVMKAINDALTRIAVTDDKLIFDGRTTKRYAPNPGITIRIRPHQG